VACCQDALATIGQGNGDSLRADQTRATGYQAQVGDCAEFLCLFVAQGIASATHCGEHGVGIAIASTGEVDEGFRWNAAGIRAISANVARLDQRDRFAQAGKPIGDSQTARTGADHNRMNMVGHLFSFITRCTGHDSTR
jgi:hypothetical protein